MPLLTLLTLNCFGVPAPGTANRLRLLARHLNERNADVVCLQEVQAHAYRKLLVRHAQAYPTHAYTPFVHAPKGGLLTLSKHAFAGTAFTLYQERGLWYTPAVADWILHKGILYTCFALEGQQIAVLNTHLNANYSGDWSEANAYARQEREQLRQLARLVNAQPPDTLVLVAGDFNIPRGSWLYEGLIRETGLYDPLAADTRPTYRPMPGMPARYAAPIDFVLVRVPPSLDACVESRLVFEERVPLHRRQIYLSDHMGVETTVGWGEA
jgi:endonuclease/exonuclease/phosphatase family metal-dependent hydrolase